MEQKLYEITEQLRKELHDMVDRQMSDFQMRLEHGKPKVRTDIEMSLATLPAYFKGKKPLSILYPNGTEVYASTWRQFAHHLLLGCAEDEVMHYRLRELRGHVYEKGRLLFSDSGEGMTSPIEFYFDMYFECDFDTESLLKAITSRILDPIGYDYSEINLKVYDPALMALESEQQDVLESPEDEAGEEQEEGFGMQMV